MTVWLSAIVLAGQLLVVQPVVLGISGGTEHGVARGLWDESRRLSSHERADLESQLVIANHRLGNPVFLLVVEKLHHDSALTLAARTFAARGVGNGPSSDPVLLVVALRDRVAAIETGKGNAGIVPEIDAQRIINGLVSRLSTGPPAPSLQRAIVEIVESAEATTARRRPLPPEPTSQSGAAAQNSDGGGGDGDNDAGVDAGAAGAPEKPPGALQRASRSKLPLAATICGLVLLALSVRRRRQIAADRRDRASHIPKPPIR